MTGEPKTHTLTPGRRYLIREGSWTVYLEEVRVVARSKTGVYIEHESGNRRWHLLAYAGVGKWVIEEDLGPWNPHEARDEANDRDDLTTAYLAGFERGRDAARDDAAELEAELSKWWSAYVEVAGFLGMVSTDDTGRVGAVAGMEEVLAELEQREKDAAELRAAVREWAEAKQAVDDADDAWTDAIDAGRDVDKYRAAWTGARKRERTAELALRRLAGGEGQG